LDRRSGLLRQDPIREVVLGLGGRFRPGEDAPQLLLGLPKDADAAVDLLPE
jgi:hypothetical protein